jgi:NAD(P)-dependent dehydrogenase (short-subunit alcohol dehydrogenase family)
MDSVEELEDMMDEASVAIVVGAGGALGRAVAAGLAGKGMSVVAVDRNTAGLEQVPDGIRREVADATDPAAAAAVVERIVAEVGPPSVLVNTIGTFALDDLSGATPEAFGRMMDVNVGAALWLSQAVAPHMRELGSGSIVHVAARNGLEPSTGTLTYSVSKAALVHLVRILDAELRPAGIRVNAVAPQLLDSPYARASFPPEVWQHAVAPEAIADVIVALSTDGSAPVSGAIVPTYGG